MQIVLNEQKLQQAIGAALHELSGGALQGVPDTGTFTALSTRFAGGALVDGVGDVELRVAPLSGDKGKLERFFEVRVSTPSGGSHSSTWVFYGKTAALKEVLKNEAALKVKIRAAIVAEAESLQRNELA
ncbi:hypothetical protein COCOR_03413 [Corallococcus coralloides DSM 2259]|uniref:Uncharacterized protein n=1 Tax=Corallococcus coralloides (strain ATCC 25202 / DSM 2259 / NBRC 100086 / M2) TaxID=1144275 RepID=H8MJ98_CORCM|nr:hypothetical protein [Corallococcus coralloides]AFE05214.1 hypothetical protein COCOR_03413 [Corallococcus coralloides DSM 2259]